MRFATRLFLAVAVLTGPAAGVGHAASGIRDLLLLKEAGLSDDILIELIQTDGSVFHLKAADIIDLHKQGLSERVIRAMLATARKPPVPTAAPAPGDPNQATAPALPDVPDAPIEDRARALVPTQDEAVPVTTEPPAGDSSIIAWPPVPMPTVEGSAAPAPTRTQTVEVYVPVVVPVAVPVVIDRRPPAPPPAPVYWGYGGQKKPGSWDEPARGVVTPAASTKPTPPSGGRGGV